MPLPSHLSAELARPERGNYPSDRKQRTRAGPHSVVQKVEVKTMKSTLKKFAFVPALSLVLAASGASAQAKMECKGPTLTSKQAMAMIARAKTAQDHNKLACYYRAEARSETAKANSHEEMGKLYESYPRFKTEMMEHCKKLVDEARQAAEADNQLAAEHEKIAAEVK